MQDETAERFTVRDGRQRGYGVVYLDHIDNDAFRNLDAAARLTYFALLPFVGSATQQAWPKVSKLAAIIGYSERTVYRAIKSLHEARFIAVGKLEFNRARRVNLYTLLEPPT